MYLPSCRARIFINKPMGRQTPHPEGSIVVSLRSGGSRVLAEIPAHECDFIDEIMAFFYFYLIGVEVGVGLEVVWD